MIEVIAGCMYSGKSEELIRRLRRCEIAQQYVKAFKPAIDNRYTEGDISTHSFLNTEQRAASSFHAIPIRDVAHLKEHLFSRPFSFTGKVIGVDEIQFMDFEIIEVLEKQANQGRRVIVAGLDLDSDGKPFGPMAELLARADKVTKLTAVCVAPTDKYDPHPCGKPATRTYRIPEKSTGELIQVGSSGIYEARCRRCWAQNGV
jgi:thymidine kinase